jgi:hypothetical protein
VKTAVLSTELRAPAREISALDGAFSAVAMPFVGVSERGGSQPDPGELRTLTTSRSSGCSFTHASAHTRQEK